MKTSPAFRWIVVLSYVALIYVTLESIGAPIRFLRHHNLLRLSLVLFYGSCLFLLLVSLWRQHCSEVWRFGMMIAVFVVLFFIGKSTGTPEEEIHFFEYGLVGILFARAIAQHTKNNIAVVLGAFFLATTAGWIDEKIQGFLPSRHYDVKDILLNAVSSFFGILVWSLFPTKTSEKP